MDAAGVDRQRFSELFRSNYEAVLRYVQRRSDGHDAQDVTSEVFVVAWRRRGELPAEPLPWLIGTARHLLANQRRGHDRLVALRLRIAHNPLAPEVQPDEQAETVIRWSRALASLSSADQEVLALLAWDGLSGREAAASMDCSESAFAMRLGRARTRLAAALERESTTVARTHPTPSPLAAPTARRNS